MSEPSPDRAALAAANAALHEASQEPRRVEAAWDKLSEMAYSRRSEIEQLQADITAGEQAHRAWRIAEVMDEATGAPPAPLEPLRQSLGRAEDDLAVLEQAVEEARARYHHPKLFADIDRAKREQNRAIADLIRVEYGPDFACWKRSLLLRIFWEQLRALGIPLDDDPLPSSDEAGAVQLKALRLLDALRADPDAALPEIERARRSRVDARNDRPLHRGQI